MMEIMGSLMEHAYIMTSLHIGHSYRLSRLLLSLFIWSIPCSTCANVGIHIATLDVHIYGALKKKSYTLVIIYILVVSQSFKYT